MFHHAGKRNALKLCTANEVPHLGQCGNAELRHCQLKRNTQQAVAAAAAPICCTAALPLCCQECIATTISWLPQLRFGNNVGPAALLPCCSSASLLPKLPKQPKQLQLLASDQQACILSPAFFSSNCS